MNTTLMVVGIVFLLFFFTIVFMFIAIYNGLVTVSRTVDKAWSNIDVLLKQRFDEIPNLVSVCERYMKHEAETLTNVIKARNMAGEAKGAKEASMADNFLKDTLKSLFAVTENYPELKADKQFGMLQNRITEIENEIADRRELYNEYVNIYNIRIAKIPDVFVASILGYRDKDQWQINPGERKAPKVSFSA